MISPNESSIIMQTQSKKDCGSDTFRSFFGSPLVVQTIIFVLIDSVGNCTARHVGYTMCSVEKRSRIIRSILALNMTKHSDLALSRQHDTVKEQLMALSN